MPPPTVVVVVVVAVLEGELAGNDYAKRLELAYFVDRRKNKEKEGIHCFNWLQLFLLGPSWMNSL